MVFLVCVLMCVKRSFLLFVSDPSIGHVKRSIVRLEMSGSEARVEKTMVKKEEWRIISRKWYIGVVGFARLTHKQPLTLVSSLLVSINFSLFFLSVYFFSPIVSCLSFLLNVFGAFFNFFFSSSVTSHLFFSFSLIL